MSDWEIHVHLDDEEQARNMMEELNAEGFGVTLYKHEQRMKRDKILQYALLPPNRELPTEDNVEA